MKCCDNYDCNQGRNCPLRVAKVGQRMRWADPLPPSLSGYWLKRLTYWALMAVFGLLWLAFLTACVFYVT